MIITVYSQNTTTTYLFDPAHQLGVIDYYDSLVTSGQIDAYTITPN